MSLRGSIRQLLKKLDDLGVANNTIVVFTTDNGAEAITWPDGGSTPFRGEKDTNWEGGWRVPFLMRWPGVMAPGQIINEQGSLQDLIPGCWRGPRQFTMVTMTASHGRDGTGGPSSRNHIVKIRVVAGDFANDQFETGALSRGEMEIGQEKTTSLTPTKAQMAKRSRSEITSSSLSPRDRARPPQPQRLMLLIHP
jgi:hypothetical protein